jgi:hypothetical protein
MILGLEIPYLAGLVYPIINDKWWKPKIKPSLDKEIQHEPKEVKGIHLYTITEKVSSPFFVNTGTILVPFAGGSYTSKDILARNYTSTDKENNYPRFQQIDNKEDASHSYEKTTYINNQEQLEKTFNEYNIKLNVLPIKLPFEAHHYHYKTGMYYHNKTRLIGSSRLALLNKVVFENRLPYSLTITALAYGGLLGCWVFYAGGIFTTPEYRKHLKDQWYPPFHYKRIQGYFDETNKSFKK